MTEPLNNTQAAARAYAESRRDIDWLLDTLRAEFEEHAAEAAGDPANWTLVGDLDHARNQLVEILAFLTEQEPGQVVRRLDETRTTDLTTTIANPTRDEILAAIAAETLKVRTLETRRSDALDFHDVAVWSIREALERAYAAGRGAAPPTRCICPACRREIEIRPVHPDAPNHSSPKAH